MTAKKISIIAAVVVALLVGVVWILSARLKQVTAERDVQLNNVNSLMLTVAEYQTEDSLHAATVGQLQLSLEQYKELRAEDAKIIESLKVDKNRLQEVITTQTESYYKHTAQLRDSIKWITRDSIQIPITIKTAKREDAWHTINIEVYQDSVYYQLRTRESLIITNHVVPKKFLWFKFGCKEVRTDVVSKNPYTEKINIETITIR
jgi:hypothetical protein